MSHCVISLVTTDSIVRVVPQRMLERWNTVSSLLEEMPEVLDSGPILIPLTNDECEQWWDLVVRMEQGFLQMCAETVYTEADCKEMVPPIRQRDMNYILQMMDPIGDSWRLYCLPDEQLEEDVEMVPSALPPDERRRQMYEKIGKAVRSGTWYLPYNSDSHFPNGTGMLWADQTIPGDANWEASINFSEMNVLAGIVHCDWCRVGYPLRLDWQDISWRLIVKYGVSELAYYLMEAYKQKGDEPNRMLLHTREQYPSWCIIVLCEDGGEEIDLHNDCEWRHDLLYAIANKIEQVCPVLYQRCMKYCLRLIREHPLERPFVYRDLRITCFFSGALHDSLSRLTLPAWIHEHIVRDHGATSTLAEKIGEEGRRLLRLMYESCVEYSKTRMQLTIGT